MICCLIVDNKEYRFATYNNAKIINCHLEKNAINITLKKGKYYLQIKSKPLSSKMLIAPVKGEMIKEIQESINANIQVILKKKNKIIFNNTIKNCGLEIVGN